MDQGGAQEALLRLARELRARGHDVETWFLYEKSSLYRNEEGIRVLLPEASPGASGYLRILGRLVRQLKAHRPDAVISFLPLANSLGQMASRLAGVRRRVASQRNPYWSYSPLDAAAGQAGRKPWLLHRQCRQFPVRGGQLRPLSSRRTGVT